MADYRHNYTPRSYFKPFHARKQRFACLVVHRRAGKTHAVIHDMVVRALRTKKRNWRGGYICPILAQSKDAAWQPLLDAVSNLPGVKISKSELSVTFPNGARIKLYSADNPDSIRGGYFDFACIDEYGDMHPSLLGTIVLPMLAGRHGSLVIIGTPKGSNHFYKRAMKAQANPDAWFYLHLTINDTGVEALSLEDQAIQRSELEDPEWNQEFLCSWTAEFRGSYYAKALDELEARQGLKDFKTDNEYKIDLRIPVECAMDVGHADATCIWFWQYVEGEVRFIDYFEQSGLDAEETCDLLEDLHYPLSNIWLPHDTFHKTFQSKKSAFDTFIARGLKARRVPNPDGGNRVYHGIDAVRKVLRTYPVVINTDKCAPGIKALRNYSRKWDLKREVYSDTPLHDQWSHGADAFRYACLSLNTNSIKESKGRSQASQLGAQRINTPIQVKQPTFDEMLKRHDAAVADRDNNYFRVRN